MPYKIIHKIPQQNTWKSHQGTTGNSHIGTAHILRKVLT
jgi:hypothetical protein